MPQARRNPTQRPRKRAPVAPERAPAGARRAAAERALAIAMMVFVGLAVLGFAATLAHLGLGPTVPWLAAPIWEYAFWVPLVALPAAIVCLIVLVAVSARGRARRN